MRISNILTEIEVRSALCKCQKTLSIPVQEFIVCERWTIF